VQSVEICRPFSA